MKKLVVGVVALFIATFFLFSFKKKPTKTVLPQQVNMTLNGVDELTARQMINNFANNYDSDIGVKSISAFYTVDQIKTINDVLVAEHNDANIVTSGVRFYFGSDQPIGGNTKLHVKIFMVSTKGKQPTANHTSTNGDYYIHTAGTLSSVEIGIATDDHASQVAGQGGLLYSGTPPQITICQKPSPHFLPGDIAYRWVQARHENGGKDPSAYNTKSEWFPYCFINSFFSALINNHYSGLRIYLAKGFKDSNNMIRDVFVLVPTKARTVGSVQVDQDDYNCLEDLPGSNFCNDVKVLGRFKLQSHRVTKDGGGYDNGELCPDVCN